MSCGASDSDMGQISALLVVARGGGYYIHMSNKDQIVMLAEDVRESIPFRCLWLQYVCVIEKELKFTA